MKYKIFYVIAGVVAIVGGFLFVRNVIQYNTSDSPLLNIHGPTPTTTITSQTPVPSSGPVTAHLISVQFSSQAPTGVWDAIHEEMCEEMTIIMAHAWVNDISLTPAFAEGEITRLVQWENTNFGTYTDTTARQTAQMGEAVYGLHTRIIDNPSVEEIQKEIDNGHIVLMGMAGRMLGNPNYTPPGPLYHMLLIKGYDSTGFITNDDGTRKGNSYHYTYGTLMAAAHDWNGNPDSMTTNPSAAIVVSKN